MAFELIISSPRSESATHELLGRVHLTDVNPSGRMFQLDAAQVLVSGTEPVPESVVVAKRDARMKPGIPGAKLGLSYPITTGVFDFYIPLKSGMQDLTFMVCDRGDSAGDSAVLFNIEGVSF